MDSVELKKYKRWGQEFYYNPAMYYVKNDELRFNQDYVGPISLPRGCTSTTSMFYKCKVKEGCYLEDFDTSNVTHMDGMFCLAQLPKGFTLGDKFITINVVTMNTMFAGASVPADFTLGDEFDTSNVRELREMFAYVKLPVGFTLGNKFNTKSVRAFNNMFYATEMPAGFTLGDLFTMENAMSVFDMFEYTAIPTSLKLPDLAHKWARDKDAGILHGAKVTKEFSENNPDYCWNCWVVPDDYKFRGEFPVFIDGDVDTKNLIEHPKVINWCKEHGVAISEFIHPCLINGEVFHR